MPKTAGDAGPRVHHASPARMAKPGILDLWISAAGLSR
jgi:hypothetical protein